MATKKKTAKTTTKTKAQPSKAPSKASKVTKKAPSRALAAARSSAVASSAIVADVSAFDALTDDFGGSSFTWEDRQLLGRVSRFLSSVIAPRLLRRAVSSGYTREEHENLWTLFIRAAGRDQSLAFAFASHDGTADAEVESSMLGALDAFENEWFPKTRAIIERFVPEAGVVRFSKSFFKDLQQQPYGPLVVDSVSTYLDRVEALATSDEAGASEVLRNLRSRGLSERRTEEVRELLREARAGRPAPAPKVPAAEWNAAQEEQARALKALRLAWNDWGTTLRAVYDVRQQIQLGLTEVKVRAEAGSPAPAPPTGDATP